MILQIGSECDKDVANFHISNYNENGQDNDHNNNNNNEGDEDGDDDEEDNNTNSNNNESGGFYQPPELAAFVASELKITKNGPFDHHTSRTKRSHNSSELGTNNSPTDAKRYKSES